MDSHDYEQAWSDGFNAAEGVFRRNMVVQIREMAKAFDRVYDKDVPAYLRNFANRIENGEMP